jgi:SAM-dependent methyltransferase
MYKSPRYILAPYVATPQDIAAQMVELADVQASDVVYDLGCGDGRLLIAAAQLRGARGLGVDIEPYWIEQSQANALQAGVSDQVQFEQRDALELDLAPASVVFLYLVHWSTQRIMQQLLTQCAPGTRVVSHSFEFESLPGSRTRTVLDSDGSSHLLHLHVIGASPD